MTPEEVTGADLIESWSKRSTRHVTSEFCPACMSGILTVGITKLVFTYEECSCGVPEYAHLVEVIWHDSCFRTSVHPDAQDLVDALEEICRSHPRGRGASQKLRSIASIALTRRRRLP